MRGAIRNSQWLLGGLLAATILAPATALAQRQGAPSPVLLELRPKAGDVVRMRLDQQVEVSGTTKRGAVDTTMTVRTDLLVLTRSVVEAVDGKGATVLAITDSVMIFSTGSAGAWIDQTQRRMRGQRLRMRLAPDGGMTLVSGGDDPEAELRSAMAQLPTTLPRESVAVGDRWKRTMAIPLSGGGARIAGEMHATFQLDSLTRGGDVAWISMKGTLRQQPEASDDHGLHADLAGTVTGLLVVDRRRGWVTDARTTMQVRSSLKPARRDEPPMRFRMTVIQRLRAL